MRRAPPAPRPGLPLSEAALSLLTLVVAGGMARLFQGFSYLGPVLVSAVAAHALAIAWRRLRLSATVSLLASVTAAFLVSIWVVLPASTWYGVPVARTVGAVGDAIAQAVTAFQTLAAPAPALPGFLLVVSWAVASAAIFADALFFRARAPLQACLPSFTLFVFTAALGSPDGRALTTALYLAAVLGLVLSIEVRRRTSGVSFIPGTPRTEAGRANAPETVAGPETVVGPEPAETRRRAQARRRLLGVGTAIGALSVAVASVVGPHLPGAGSAALVTWHTRRSASPGRIAESPLVDLKAELLSPPSVQVFSVAAARPAYWRLTALDHFNGTVWSSNQAYRPAAGPLPAADGAPATAGPHVEVSQTYRIDSLASAWLPAAYRPVQVRGLKGAGYDPSSASLITGSETSPGLTYTVRSIVSDLTPARLGRARVNPRDPGLAPYLQLPGDLPRSVIRLARRVTQGQPTPYAKALALQRFFRQSFTYSLSPPPDDSVDALVDFLFVTREGYCQQFAGAYAVMARAVGLPARVAIGFTPGQLGRDGRYHVLALDAHAWPEVFLGRYGWVPFEPTVSRGEPGAQAYTGVAPQQAEPAGATPAAASTPQGSVSSGHRSSAAPPRHAASSRPALSGTRSPGGSGARFVPVLAGGLALVVVALALVVPWLRRRRRRARATEAERVMVAFTDAAGALARRGLARQPSETFSRFALRAAPRCPPGARRPLAELALAAEAAVFGPRPPSRDEVMKATEASRSIRRSLRRLRGLRRLRPPGGTALEPGP